ncbi:MULTISPECIES: SGNH/GDSL hydrolase family protein [unclassified Fusibacter]|uniref:SGNH/GDSL hydrolase family protein n=1 Tax=unclassified Fusibacter TaxID=2624464 RepID=UPI0010109236|nr:MULTISPECIES: SGNH/GDSL hydrolase family protein [unclassified Fusibacter]MCK8060107.1 SGNH/GDSL hydrolase family protein [Fusibacter sp. A2]NPE22249.1 hypothetical protein [Fusibacter sp. A1]RXV61023.1 hypothetical protein DWB64_10415 [Fusibacter sp. A1]
MKRKLIHRTAIILLIALFAMSFNSMIFASKPTEKPQNNSRQPAGTVAIVSPDKLYTVPVDGELTFQVIGKLKPKAEDIEWTYELNTTTITTPGTITIETRAFNSTSFAEVTFTPSGYDEGMIYDYTITATNNADPEKIDEVHVRIAVTPDIEVYVALGDSIPLGTFVNFNPDPFKDHHLTYVDQFGQAILAEEVYNYAVDGAKISDLLAPVPITTSTAIMLANIERADIITLSIGSNDLMQAALHPLDPYPMYNFNSINLLSAELGRDTFVSSWESLILMIKSLNPTATLMVQNLYNPYDSDESGSTVIFDPFPFEVVVNEPVLLRPVIDMYLYAPGPMMGMNTMIEGLDEALMYLVVDAYQAFDQTPIYTHFYDIPLPYDYDWPYRDPHPSQLGQNKLAELHYEELMDYYKEIYFH